MAAAEDDPRAAILLRAGGGDLAALREATARRRAACHPLSLLRYEAEALCLTESLAEGDLPAARDSCRAAVAFLAAALAHVPAALSTLPEKKKNGRAILVFSCPARSAGFLNPLTRKIVFVRPACVRPSVRA